ncbi:MAG TPA: alpha/beta hydrolase [Allosphingosinicella sp.]|jgi:pimeloyl-ACP methyl ester carboxylesterase
MNLSHLPRAGRRLAFRHRRGREPTIVFLPGYRSDMEGAKAAALDAWAGAEGRAMLRFDYAGCGMSDGEFEAQTLAGWRDDALAMVDRVENPVLLVGSSMGGWLMLLVALARPERMAGLVGIAAAPDFTDWGFDEGQKHILREEGRLAQASPYDEQPEVTTRAFWESGEALRLLGREIAVDCPVRLLHGMADRDVPWRISAATLERLRTPNARLTLVKGGDHRLSRGDDIALLIRTCRELLEPDKETGHYIHDKACSGA